MANGMFDIETRNLEALARFYRAAPRIFAQASGSMLNEFAFGTRVEAFYEIASKMTVRNPKFVASRLQVTKASKSLPFQAQQSIIGSVATQRFSAWQEQQLGKDTARKRTISLLARMGSISRQAAPRARLKPGNRIWKPEPFPGKDINQKSIVMMQKLSRAGVTEPFLLMHKTGMIPGLYRFKGGKPRLLQSFAPKQPRKIPWLTAARDRYMRETNMPALWAKTLGYALSKRARIVTTAW
jgi:hypothetical protein